MNAFKPIFYVPTIANVSIAKTLRAVKKDERCFKVIKI